MSISFVCILSRICYIYVSTFIYLFIVFSFLVPSLSTQAQFPQGMVACFPPLARMSLQPTCMAWSSLHHAPFAFHPHAQPACPHTSSPYCHTLSPVCPMQLITSYPFPFSLDPTCIYGTSPLSYPHLMYTRYTPQEEKGRRGGQAGGLCQNTKALKHSHLVILPYSHCSMHVERGGDDTSA